MKIKLLLAAFIFMGLTTAVYKGYVSERPAAVSETEAKALAASAYDGKIQSIEWSNETHTYEIVLENEKGSYAMSVDGQSKKISNVTLLEKKKTRLTLNEARKKISEEANGIVTSISDITGNGDPRAEAIVDKNGTNYRFVFNLAKGETISSNEIKVADAVTIHRESNPSIISEQTAKEVAAGEVNGNVTRIETIKTSSGDHYKVTIETETGGADVYVQASSAKVSSISRFNNVNQESPAEPESKSITKPSAPAAVPKAATKPEPAQVEQPSVSADDGDE